MKVTVEVELDVDFINDEDGAGIFEPSTYDDRKYLGSVILQGVRQLFLDPSWEWDRDHNSLKNLKPTFSPAQLDMESTFVKASVVM